MNAWLSSLWLSQLGGSGGGGGLENIVEDLTPELGGDLSVNDYEIKSKAPPSATSDSGDIIVKPAAPGATSGNAGDISITGESGSGVGHYGSSITIRSGDGFHCGDIVITAEDNGNTEGTVYIEVSPINGLHIRGVDGAGSGYIYLDDGGRLFLKELATNGTNSVGLRAADSLSGSTLWTVPADQESLSDPLGIDLGEYLVANLPSAVDNKYCRALVTDYNGAGGGSGSTRAFVRSDGTNWKYIADEGITVS